MLTTWLMLYTGGAERLIVDAAVELASHGHNVHIFTAHHDRARCFEETLAGENFVSLPLILWLYGLSCNFLFS